MTVRPSIPGSRRSTIIASGRKSRALARTVQSIGRPFHIEAAIGQLSGDFSRRLVVVFYEKNLRHEIVPTAKLPSPRTARLGRNDTQVSR
jgi:hypothetical protein